MVEKPVSCILPTFDAALAEGRDVRRRRQGPQGRGRQPGVRSGQQGHRRRAEALPRLLSSRHSNPFQPLVPRRVCPVGVDRGRGRMLPSNPHGK